MEDFTIKIVNGYTPDNNKTYTNKSLKRDVDRAFEILNANPNILYDITNVKISTEVGSDEENDYTVIFKFTVPVFDMPDKIISPRSDRTEPTLNDEGNADAGYVSEDELLADLDSVDMDAVAIRFVIYIMSEQWLTEVGLPPLPEVISEASVEQKLCLLENIADRYVPGYTIDDVENLLALGDEDEV